VRVQRAVNGPPREPAAAPPPGNRILKIVLTPDQEEIITLAWPDE